MSFTVFDSPRCHSKITKYFFGRFAAPSMQEGLSEALRNNMSFLAADCCCGTQNSTPKDQ